MLYDKRITDQSYSEMLHFLSFANRIGETPLLFGGWAVYQYNPYAGSKDVDFVVSDTHFDECVDFLVKTKGYDLREGRLAKGEVFFDLYKEGEGITTQKETLDFDRLYKRAERVYLRGGRLEVLLPSLSDLFLFKAHALVGRNVPKDKSDVIALLLKFSEGDFQEKNRLGTEVKEKLGALTNKIDVFSLVVKPTQKNIREINGRIKRLIK
ncbi:hypothetical protein HY546_02425 [archaeon]|nr:hypothetical protein [archaeon]